VSQAEPPRLADFLQHLREAIGRIDRYTTGFDLTAFRGDEKTQDAVIRNLEIIGEALSNVRTRFPDFESAHPELPFGAAYGMRNVLAHGYFRVDLDIVWRTLQEDLPRLKEQVERVLAQG
jgi:uncharacterized protein with HEPN domain